MKRFKAFLMGLVLVTCMLGTSGTASASTYSTGKAVIPWYNQSSTTWCGYFVSNITNLPIDVSVTLYNEDGTVVTDDNSPGTGRITANISGYLLNYNDQNTNSTLTFTISPHCTVYFKTGKITTSTYTGYGVIQWQQSSDSLQGLVCYGIEYDTGYSQLIKLPIEVNNGLPF